jgi:hypothetical protein
MYWIFLTCVFLVQVSRKDWGIDMLYFTTGMTYSATVILFWQIDTTRISNVFQSSPARFSVHPGRLTTTLLLCICIPLAMLLICAHRLPEQLLTFSMCAALVCRDSGTQFSHPLVTFKRSFVGRRSW